MTTTLTYSTSLLGRAPMPVPAGAHAIVASHAPVRAFPAAASAAHAVTASTWLGGSGSAGHMGSGYTGFGSIAVACDSTVDTTTTNATKRIDPGRLEGMT